MFAVAVVLVVCLGRHGVDSGGCGVLAGPAARCDELRGCQGTCSTWLAGWWGRAGAEGLYFCWWLACVGRTVLFLGSAAG